MNLRKKSILFKNDLLDENFNEQLKKKKKREEKKSNKGFNFESNPNSNVEVIIS